MSNANPPRPGPSRAGVAFLLLVPLLVGFYLVPLRIVGWGFEYTPGEPGDPRFNAYVLEHGTRYLRGLEPSFWDAPFCYPHRNVIAMSDSHIGTLPLFAAYRAVGLDRETAFQAWFCTFFVLNYLACAWALLRFGFAAIGAAAGAYLYAFGLPVLGQMDHAQLLPRFLVPVAFYLAWRFLHRPTTAYFAGLAGCVLWQLYCTVYIGYFLMLILVPFLAAYAWMARHDIDWEAIRRPGRAASWRRVAVVLAAGVGLVPLAIPHWKVAQEVGVRNWWTMAPMMPQPRSFLLPPHDSLCWSWLDWQAVKLGKFVHEHAMFAGAVAWGCAAAALFGLRRLDPERRRLARAAAVAIAAVCVLVMYAFDFSLYRAVAALPLANAVRAVSRVILVLLFPFAVAAAGAFTCLELWAAGRTRWPALAPLALFGVLVADNVVTQAGFERHPKARWQERTRQLTDQVRSAGDAKVFVYLSHAEDRYRIPTWCIDQIDAILASQDTGVPTINAYSGNWPAGWQMPMRSWELIDRWVGKARENARAGKTRPGDPDHLFDGLVVIGEPTGERPPELAGVRVVPLAAGR